MSENADPEIAQAHRDLDRFQNDREVFSNDVTALQLEFNARRNFESAPELQRRFKPEVVKVIETDLELTQRHIQIQGRLIQILDDRSESSETVRVLMQLNQDHVAELQRELSQLSLA